MLNQKYGVVYTPDSLATFVAALLYRFSDITTDDGPVVLDPAAGECSLLKAAKQFFVDSCRYVGIDIDIDATRRSDPEFEVVHNDAILPNNIKSGVGEYWRKELGNVEVIIANPPWSSEKIYGRNELAQAGYTFITGQYDSYVLFIELAYSLLRTGGTMAFIIPDSLFDAQNTNLRKFLTENMQIKVIARLGEKIFDEVNRATTVIICKKELPDENSITECFRLSTEDRKSYLAGAGSLIEYYQKSVHAVKQLRFSKSEEYHFDIDTFENEEALIRKISSISVDWSKEFTFGRGVEISKSGRIVCCPYCGNAQGYSKKQFFLGRKDCAYCKSEVALSESTVEKAITKTKEVNSIPIYVGENIQRYGIHGNSYIKRGIEGINYKTPDIYTSPKLLVRKTGLGINCVVDHSGFYTSQTVYILRSLSENVPLEYYLAIINSRVVYYYYLKVYGENEWKSHPYLTKGIIFSFPIRPYEGDKTDIEIVDLAKRLMGKYDRDTDLQLEKLVMKKYKLNKKEQQLIAAEMNRLPDLDSVNKMKMEA